jgi:iron complex outermembrane receptor protein
MKRGGTYVRGAVVALLGVVVWTSIVFGQETEDYELQSIKVTANKQEEDVENVPISITVFDEIFLEDNMIETAADIDDFTPGMEIVTYGTALKSAPAMRGIYSDYSSRSQSAGMYVDGIPIIDGTGFDETLMDIERVEVLRGPQGTLYGKNSQVGVVNIITRRPDNEMRGRLSAEFGEDEKMQFSFTASGPVVKDNFYIGLSGRHYQKDGFITNPETGDTIDDRKNNYGKINLRWTPTEAIDAFLVVSKVKHDDGANRMNVYGAEKDREISTDLDAYNKSEVTLTALNISYEINEQFDLNSITTRRFYNEKNANDFDYTNQTFFHVFADSDFEKISQELRLNYSALRFKMLMGAYLDMGENDINRIKEKADSTTFINQEEDGQSIGLFTHLAWSITDRLIISGGIRYDNESKDFRDEGDGTDVDESWTEISPKITLKYQLDDMVVYFQKYNTIRML